MREDDVAAAVLPHLAVRLFVGAIGEQQRPGRAGGLERQPARVECLHPGWQRVGVVLARSEQRRLIPVHLLLRPSERENRAAIFAAHRERACRRVDGFQPVEERRAAKAPRRRARSRDSEQRSQGIQHTLQVANDSGVRRPHPRENRRMPGRRLGDCVVLVGLGEERPFVRQLRQSTRQLALPAAEVVGPQLIDRDDDDELRPGRWRIRGREAMREQRDDSDDVHRPKVAAFRCSPPQVSACPRGFAT